MIKSIIDNIGLSNLDVHSQSRLIDAYSSNVEISNVSITDLDFTDTVIKMSLSTLTISQMETTNISNTVSSRSAFISMTSECYLYLDGIMYSNSNVSFILLNDVYSGWITNFNISDVNSLSSLFQIDSSMDLEVSTGAIVN